MTAVETGLLILQWLTLAMSTSFLGLLVRQSVPAWKTLDVAGKFWVAGLIAYSLTTITLILVLLPRDSNDWVDVVGFGFLGSFVLLHRALYLESSNG